jgi:hypothetical protein
MRVLLNQEDRRSPPLDLRDDLKHRLHDEEIKTALGVGREITGSLTGAMSANGA